MLLIALFFYDIFFVFGTDVMLTVAKSIDAPIKLLFPTEWGALNAETGEPEPKFSLLGLGDIVIPGVFVSLCLRFDIIKQLNIKRVNELMESNKADEVLTLLRKCTASPKTHYFYGCLVGYLLAIITTVVIMIVFEHG